MGTTVTPPAPDVWVRFLRTLDRTATEPAYQAGSIWHMSAAHAADRVAVGDVEYCDAPPEALRPVAEPLEPAPMTICYSSAIPARDGYPARAIGAVATLPYHYAQGHLDAKIAERQTPAPASFVAEFEGGATEET